MSNCLPNYNYSSGNNANDIIKNQENIINQLKRTIQVYEQNAEQQNRKLSNHDSLLIEYNSLMKNYSELEKELSLAKNENMQLKSIINTKNQTIAEYQGLFLESKAKFETYEQTNNSLKLKIKELESKLSSFPGLMDDNNELNLRIREYENRLKLLREECNKKEELYKVKLDNLEKISKTNAHSYEEEVNELNSEIKKLKNEISILKRKNDDMSLTQKNADNDYNAKIRNKEKEIEKLTKTVNDLRLHINDNAYNNKSEAISNKNLVEKLKIDNENLYKALDERDQQINELNLALNDADNVIKQSEYEINTRENTINNLAQEKELLLKQLNDKQIDFVEFQNSAQQEIDMLHNKLDMLEKEKNMLISDNENHQDEINQLHDDLNQYLCDDEIHFEECKEADKKYNELAEAYKMKEKDCNSAIAQLNVMNNNLRTELELLKSKYEKKIKILTLNNEELNTRVKNLINTLISLKDYALSIERQLNDVPLVKQQDENNNYSMFVGNNFSSFGNNDINNINNNCIDCGGNNINHNLNMTYQMRNNYDNLEQNQNSREFIKNMKNMIDRIDVKLNEELEQNQTC